MKHVRTKIRQFLTLSFIVIISQNGFSEVRSSQKTEPATAKPKNQTEAFFKLWKENLNISFFLIPESLGLFKSDLIKTFDTNRTHTNSARKNITSKTIWDNLYNKELPRKPLPWKEKSQEKPMAEK